MHAHHRLCLQFPGLTINICTSLCSEITSKRKAFTSPTLSKPINKEVEGEVSLQQYQDVISRAEYIEELQQYGLTQDEIEIKLKYEGLDAEGKVCSTNMGQNDTKVLFHKDRAK